MWRDDDSLQHFQSFSNMRIFYESVCSFWKGKVFSYLYRRTDQLEEVLSNNQDGTAIKSRASSSSSLDRLSNDSGTPTSNSTLVNGTVTNTISNPTLQSSVSNEPWNDFVC